MNRSEIITAALADAHREDYATVVEDGIALPDRFMAEAEALISARLESYALEYQFTDADRGGITTSPVYTLPPRVTLVRHLFKTGCPIPLSAVDETIVGQRSRSSGVECYAVRARGIIVAGTPAAETTLDLHYFGLPAPLVQATDTNTLLNDFPQLYKEAFQIPVFKRARDYEAVQAINSSVQSLIDEINRKVKKLLGGARSSNPYNVTWRSSY